MHRGFIKIWRKIEDSGIIFDADLWQLFSYLLIKANYKPTNFIYNKQKIRLEAGQILVGRKRLAEILKSSERKIRTNLKTLENLEIIDQQTTNKFTIVSICNWLKYQNQENRSLSKPYVLLKLLN